MRRLFGLIVAFSSLAFHAFAADPAVHFISSGKDGAQPILFLPGLSSDGSVWDETAKSFSSDYEIHQATLAGFAGKPTIEGPFIETRLDGLKDYLEANDLRDAIVVGHSLGGAMALMLARDEPERVQKAIIVDSVPFLAQFFLGAQNLEQAEPRAAGMREQITQMNDEQFKAQQSGFAMTQTSNADGQEKILEWSLASDRTAVGQAMYELLTTDLRGDLADIKTPLLVIYPWRAGGPFTAEQTDGAYGAQYANAKTAKLRRIDDSAHFIMFDQPEALTGAIADFISD